VRATRMLAAAAVVGSACALFEPLVGEGPQQAQWAVEQTFVVTPETTEVPLLVGEVACASGRDATGRISVDVEYGEDVIAVTAFVRPLPGGQDCPSSPPTPFRLQFDEPVGDRALVNGATTEIARRPLELPVQEGPGDAPVSAREGQFVPDEVMFLAEALFVRAHDHTELADVTDLSPHPDGVDLLLGDDLVRTTPPDELTGPDAWTMEVPEHAGLVGPFSALDVLRRADRVTVALGAHPHCASPPRPPPPAYDELRRVTIEPADTDSCLGWFGVNLYLDGDGWVRAVQLHLWEP
jgi:hypothetical protein